MNVSPETLPVIATDGLPSLRPDEVLVVVPTLNEAAHIETCLHSLIGDDAFMAKVRIVVADGKSRDLTVAIVQALKARYPNLVLIDNPDRFQSVAINAAVAAKAEPTHKYLVRCDAHSVYPAGYVCAVVESLIAHPEAASVTTAMDGTGQSCVARAAAWIVDTPLGSGGSAHRGGRQSGWVDHAHHAGFRLDWFRKVEGYDESFSHNEDAEFDHRLKLAGGKIWLDATIRLDYRMRDSLHGLWFQYWRYGRGRARNVLKHRIRPAPRQLLPAAATLGIGISLALGLFWPPALLIAGAYLAAVAAVSLTGFIAMKSFCGLWAGLAMAAIHLAWGLGFLVQALQSWRAR
jgi:succinoglycan biosynthesis protein ExoA